MPYINTDPCSKPNPSPNNGFENLVQDLSDALGPSSGLDSDDIDPMDILRLMERYDSNPDEWLPFALGDSKKNYTRNLIDEGNGKSNLVSSSYLAYVMHLSYSCLKTKPLEICTDRVCSSSFWSGVQEREAQYMITLMHTAS